MMSNEERIQRLGEIYPNLSKIKRLLLLDYGDGLSATEKRASDQSAAEQKIIA